MLNWNLQHSEFSEPPQLNYHERQSMNSSSQEKHPNNKPENPSGPLQQWLHPGGLRFWAIALMLAYTIGGFFLVPYLLKNGLVTYIEDDLGRSADINRIEFNPYVLSLRVTGFEIRDTDEVSLASFDQLFVNFQLSSLFNWAWTFDEISLLGSYVYFERFDSGDSRLSRLLDGASAESSPLEETETEEAIEQEEGLEKNALPRLLIHHLALSKGKGRLKDAMPETPVDIDLGPIDIVVKELNTLPDRYGQQDVIIKLPDDASLQWQGSLGLAPLLSEGSLSLVNANIDKTIAYLDTILPLRKIHALLSANLKYRIYTDDTGTFNAEINELNIALDELALEGLSPSAEFLSMAKIVLINGTIRYPEQSVQFDGLHIEAPAVSTWLNQDGQLNLTQLAATGNNPPELGSSVKTETETTVSTDLDQDNIRPWQVAVDLISIDRGKVDFTDHRLDPAPRIEINDLAIKLAKFNIAEGTQLPLSVSGKFSEGGQFNVDGTVNLLPALALDLQLQTQDVPLSMAQAYVQQNARLVIDSGVFNSDLSISLPRNKKLSLIGSIEIPNLDIKDSASKTPLIAWRALALEHLELDLNTNKLELSTLDFQELYARFAIHEDQSSNISSLMVKRDTDTGAEKMTDKTDNSGVRATPMDVLIGGIRINDASLDFSDDALPLPFATHIDKLTGSISAFATDSDETAKVQLEGQVNDYGLARIAGEINLLEPVTHTDITLEFHNLDMPRMSPYSGQFAGRAISTGKLKLELNYLIEQGMMTGENNILLSDLTLGKKIDSPNASALPLDLAIALLKDPDGVINAELSVTGDVNDPTFALGGVIWEAVVGIITDAVTAPFRLLGNLLGITSEELGQFQFLAGRADLTPPELEKIAQLEQALLQRPHLAITVSGAIDPLIDLPALQLNMLRDALIEQRGEDHKMDNKDIMLSDNIRAALESLFHKRFPDFELKALKKTHQKVPEGHPENNLADKPEAKPKLDELSYIADLRDRLLAAQNISEQQLTELANARAEVIRAAFISNGKLEASRVSIIAPTEVSSKDGQWVTTELSVAL